MRVRVTELGADGERRHDDRLATEEPLEIRLGWPGVAAHRVWVTMRTPGHDFELAAGWLVHEGVVEPGDIATVAYCTDATLLPEQEFNVVTVTLRDRPRGEVGHRHDTTSTGSSACGVCGKDSVTAVLEVVRASRWQGPAPDPVVVRTLPTRLRSHQSVFATTGGAHAAGLFTADGRALLVREDVGRHNAVDKVTGARTLAGQPVAEAFLAVSGRAGFELVQKAVAAGVGALVSVGAPTSLSVRLAEDAGLGLFGFVSAERCVRYA